MGPQSGSASHDDRDSDDEEDYDDGNGGNRLLGFMFGNVDNSGELDVDYLDEDAKEHLDALADKLGPSFTDIDLSGKSPQTSVATAEEDYDEKAEDAIDYEDIAEQYEGPEIEVATEEDHLLPKTEYLRVGVAATLEHKSSVFDDEDYDEDEETGKDSEEEPAASDDAREAKNVVSLPVLCVEDGKPILRFSEIFGVNEPLKRTGRREQKYFVPKDKYITLDSSFIVEEDEEAFLKASCQMFSHRMHLREVSEDNEVFMDENPELIKFDVAQGTHILDARKDSCLSAEPMRKDLALDPSVEQHSCLSMEFYSLDQQEWEDRIIWGNSPTASESFVESCELSGPDSESAFHEEREIVSRPHSNLPANKIVEDEKANDCHVGMPSISVEPFGSADSVTQVNISSETINHPQLLRLESRLERDSSNLSDDKKELVSEENQQFDLMKRFNRLTLQNKDLVEGSWVENILWESEKPIPKPKLILDLQDEQMVFEISDSKDYEHLQHCAGAVIMTRNGKSGPDSLELPGHMMLSGGRFNIGNDKYYSNRKTSPQLKSLSKKRAAHSVKVLHSIPALKLQTMKPKLSNKDIANFHRPRATWYPHDNEVVIKEQGKLPTQGPMKVILKSLGGKGCKIQLDAKETVTSFKSKASKKLDFKLTETVKIIYSGKELEDQKTLAEQNVRPNSLLHLVRTKVHLLPMAQKLPNENKSLRPPGAFKKKSDLSVKDGHVFLMEYCEERPLLLGNAGMGARLCTYYQKSSSDDQTGDMLRNTNSGLGTVLTLDPADKSPFLGDIKPGCSQSCLETNMYRAPVFPHKVASTDYLLVRSAKGKLSIRRIDKIHVVGQQEPHMEVMSPAAKGLQTYIMNRLLVYMYREFRAAEKRGMLPCIRADELSALFPHISEPFLRKRLKHCADLQKGPNGQLHWVMRRNFHIPPEEELRRMVTPETVCAYESMQAGLHRLKRLGITRLAHLTGPTQLAALSSAMNQLPDEAIALAAASHIERELQITPWNLSANFVACMSQDRGNIERLEISGVGDPSGRGLGFSYVRVAPKPPVSNVVKKKPAVARGTTVTGTDADLRRLSMEAAREVLLKFHISEEQIEKLSRWHRIALIRKLSSEQAASGVKVDPTTISKYARGQRMSFLQLQQQSREKCQEIWDRQIQSLSAVEGDENESDSEANSDLDSFAGDLENLLDAEEGEEGEEGNLEMRNYKSDGVKGLKMRRHPSQARLEEEMEDEAAEAAELCRMLMDDEDAQWKKKKKSKPPGEALGLVRAPPSTFGFETAEQVKKPNNVVKQTEGPSVSDTSTMMKQNADQMELEKLHLKKTSVKAKATKKNDVLPVSLLNKKVKIMTEGTPKVFKEKKSARESFVCGACGQLGHMRTNKNCPKYGEDTTDAQATNVDQEKEPPKPIPQDPSQSQPRLPPKKLISKSVTKVAQVEASETEKSSSKAKVLKVRCASTDKVPDKMSAVPSLSSEQPSTSEAETGNKSAPKVIKIVSNKTKPDDVQVDSHKVNLVIRPPSEAGKDQPHKKITIRQPKEVINIEHSSQDGADIEYRKTRKMIELTGYGQNRQQDGNFLAEETARRKNKESRRMWEEEQRRRNAERIQEERARRLYEEDMRRVEEQDRLAELAKYQEDIRREREEEERRKAMKKKKKKKRTPDFKDDYFDDFPPKRNNRLMPERDRTAKRKPIVELGRFAAEYVPPTKRRRGGEVGLANILENIVETLKERREVSYLFLKPVSKKEAPDYANIIEHPMDLSTIKEKVRRFEYKDRKQFRHDVWQITYNAHLYNDGRNPGIPPLADQLLEICDYLLFENSDALEEAEASIADI